MEKGKLPIKEHRAEKTSKIELYNGDCLEVMDTLIERGVVVDLVVTSPPYYNAREYSQYNSVGDYMENMQDIFTACFHMLNESKMCIVNISPVLVPRESRSKQSYRIPLPFYFVPMMEGIGFEFLEDIVWKKPDGASPNRNGGFFRHRKPLAYKPNIVTEYILVFKKPSNKLIDKFLKNSSLVTGEYERTNVWEFNPETRSAHSAPFPLQLPTKCITYYSYENDKVLDPFMGSGTTGVACKNLDRDFIGIELDEDYFKIAKDRIENTK
jgi:DNA modification methylase